MRIGDIVLNLDSLSEDDLTEVIREARRLRARKSDAHSIHEGLLELLHNAKNQNFDLCSKYTGEVLKADDWLVYDNELKCPQEGTWLY